MVSREDIKWLQGLYKFFQEMDEQEDVTIGVEGDSMLVNIGTLKRGIKTLFQLVAGVESLRRILPGRRYYHGSEES